MKLTKKLLKSVDSVRKILRMRTHREGKQFTANLKIVIKM